MLYVLTFLEGILAFISPCMLPLIPIYIAFLSGGKNNGKKGVLINAIGFVIGFSLVFILLGVTAASIGLVLKKYTKILNIVCGLIIVVFGLNFAGFINIGFLNSTKKLDKNIPVKGFFSAILFGIVFSIGWTPCIGAFLGSALNKAATSASILSGFLLLLTYSIGFGLPFIISAIFFEQLDVAFSFIKKHYNIITKISGIFLIAIGLLMIFGYFTYFINLFL